MKLVAETRFAAFSFVIATQRVSSKNMSTDLRDLLGGNRIGFASETEETDKMIFGDLYKDAPCYRIGADLKGVGYISTDSQKPILFKGYFANEYDELNAAANSNNEPWGAIRDEIFNK